MPPNTKEKDKRKWEVRDEERRNKERKTNKGQKKEIRLRSTYQSLGPKQLWRLRKKAKICYYGVSQGMWEVAARQKNSLPDRGEE